MSDRQKAVLFYVNSALISLVNLILIYALFSYFVLRQPCPQVKWLLGVFATEVLGCFVLGCRKLFGPESKAAGTGSPAARGPEVTVVGTGNEALAIEKTKVSEDARDPDVILKEKGVALLVLARDNSLPTELRKKYAHKALRIFAQIPKDSAAYASAQYNAGTAYRVLGDFQKAVSAYGKVREIVSESGTRYTEQERRLWAADIEMMIGTVYYEQDLAHQAKTFYLRSWKLDPDNLIRMLNLFDLAFKSNDLAEAQMWAEMMAAHDGYSSLSVLVESKVSLLQNGSPQKAA